MNKPLLKQALEFTEFCWRDVPLNEYGDELRSKLEDALRAELAKPDPEPVAWIGDSPTKGNGKRVFLTRDEAWEYAMKIAPLYAAPTEPNCKWPRCHNQEFQKKLADEVASELITHIPAPRGFIAQPGIDGVVRTGATNCNRHQDAPHVLVPESMIIDSESVRFLDSLSQPDDDGNYSEIRLLFGNGHAGYGMYACLDEYPEEGAEIIYRVTAISQGATHQTRNCSRHPDAPHGPDGAGCKCHSWAPGEAS